MAMEDWEGNWMADKHLLYLMSLNTKPFYEIIHTSNVFQKKKEKLNEASKRESSTLKQ
jgi:hypothetical protein